MWQECVFPNVTREDQIVHFKTIEPMKIFYDSQTFNGQRFGGISRYFVELFDGSGDLFEPKLGVLRSDNLNLRQSRRFGDSIRGIALPNQGVLAKLPGGNTVFKIVNKIRRNYYRARNRRRSRACLREGDFDLFHPTYYSPEFLDDLGAKPFVLTVYDMIHELFPDHFGARDTTSAQKKMLAEQATRVIAISENTKRDLVRILEIDADKIDVIHLASSLRKPEVSANDFPALPERYLLYTGNRSHYKNFQRFFQAVAPDLRENDRLSLVCTGSAFDKKEQALFDSYDVGKKVLYFLADDVLLGYLYSRATLFIFPSLYEGFGLPILEAFECGCPALLSETGSLPEIGGDAAVYFNPYEEESIRSAVNRVLGDEELQRQMIAAGNERAKEFSWRNTVAATAECYRKTLGSGSPQS